MHLCPDCKKELIEVTFDSEKAGKIHCFYCSNCGGAFFEHWDSNLLTLDEIKRELERVFSQEEDLSQINTEPDCPFDQSTMRPVISEAVPSNVRIYFCPFCHGNWFPKSELVKFKQAQERKVLKFKSMNLPLASVFSVFLPVLLVFTMLGSAFLIRHSFLTGVQQGLSTGASGFYKMLHAKQIDSSKVEISFYTEEPVKSTLSYNKPGEEMKQKQENDFSRYHYVLIDGLNGSQNYLFQIKSVNFEGKEFVSEWMSAK